MTDMSQPKNAVILIDKPKAGETQIVTIGDGTDKVNFLFSLDGAHVELRDIDLVVRFADGSSVVLVGFGLKLVEENPIELSFNGVPLDTQSLLAMVGEFVASDVPVFNNMATEQVKVISKKDSKTDTKDAQPQVEIIEVRPEPNNHKYDVAEEKKHSEDGSGDTSQSTVFPSVKKGDWDEPSAPAGKTSHFTGYGVDQASVRNGDGVDAKGDGTGKYDVPVPEIVVRLFGVTEVEISSNGSGLKIQSGLAAAPAEKDPSFIVQKQVDRTEGTAFDDVIHADSTHYAGISTFSRLVELTTKMPESDWVVSALRISGLPAGYSIIGANLVNGSYVVPVDPTHPDKVDVVLQYLIPDATSSPDASGFFSYFALKLDYDITSAALHAAASTSGTVQFGVRDVVTEADATFTNPITGAPVYVLWSIPPGSVVHAGAGDDTVYAGAGVDVLDGGSGNDTLSYRTSNAGVAIDLSHNSADGGYAKGDMISNFENLEGSKFDDHLVGDAGANSLTGGAGADLLDGGAGEDTARYDSSLNGVTVDLSTGRGHGGDAEGDVLVSIENVYGSAFADKLIGDAGDNELHGGGGNDTLIGGGGADLLDGGDGIDTADYAASLSGIALDLALGLGSAGDAAGDRLNSIEVVVGTAYDDTVFGSTASETLKGGDGNDILDGRAGEDILQGGAGDDVLTGGTGADQLDGGDGNDTASYATSAQGVTVDLTTGKGQGGDAEGDRLIAIENLVGSGLADTLIGNGDANRLSGGAGDDLLRGGGGADRLDGGAGFDTADYSTSAAGVTIDLATDTATGGEAAGDMLLSIEGVIGSAMNDTLIGNAADNSLSGGAGDDVLIGGAGADRLEGGSGNDTVSYDGSVAAVQIDLSTDTGRGGDAEGDVLVAIENVTGSAGDDTLTGDEGANVLSGGAGDDLLTGGAGADTIDGGAGNDTASYAGSDQGVTVDLATGIGQSGDAAGDRLIGIENLIGSDQADVLRGDAAANELHGRAGDDVLLGGAGSDVLDGGTGFDIASYVGSAAAVTVDLGTGSASGGDAAGDTLTSIEGVIGSDFDDMLRAGAAAAVLSGGLGNDTLIGGAGADTLSGGAGDDLLTGGAGADVIDGGTGVDTVSYAGSGEAVNVDLRYGTATGGDAQGDTLTNIENAVGSDFGDTLIGSAAANLLSGGAGDDTLLGGAGGDVLDGGAGSDTADYSSSGFGVTVNLATGINGGGDAQGDTLISIERIVGSAFADTLTGGAADDTLVGGAGDDILAGAAGNDRLEGGDGNDLLTGGAGGDLLIGGAGIDTASYADSTAGVQIDLAVGTGLGGDAAGDTLSGIENVVGSSGDDVLRGDSGANRLEGGLGSDRLEGGGGDDVLIGGSGDDVLIGGGGADVLQGGDGSDTVDYSASTSGIGLNLATRTGSGGDADGDTFFDIESVTGTAFDDTLIGSAGANTIIGGAGNDVIDGGAGNDVIDAGSGDDVVTGGAGADELHGGAGHDILSYAQSSAAVTVDLAAGSGLGGAAEGDVFDGFEEVQGSALADTLRGAWGDETLRGGAGDDLLEGRGGADILDGGAGTDTVSYASSASAVRIDLDAGTASGGDAQGDTLISIERVVGSAHDDWLKAAAAGSRLDGGAGDDTLVAGAGFDTLIGGGGTDLADYSASNAGVTVDLTAGTGSGGYAAGDTLSGIEHVLGSAFADRLTGDAGANTLTGGRGDDVLAGLGGADILDGGAGFDTLDYAASGTGVVIDFASGTGTGGDAQGDSFSNIEAVRGSDHDDRFIGNAAAHSIFALGGDDTIVAGAGAEAIDGGSGFDTVDYSGSNAAITVDLGVGTASGGFAQGDTLLSVEGVVGTAGHDTLIGSAGVNQLAGGAGDDLVRGGAGADILDGGAGVDTLDYSTSTAGVAVNLATGFAMGGDATGDTIANFENILGSALADTLTGSAAANTLTGGAGDDVLAGLGGADILDGGAGFDLADYSASSAAVTIDLGAGTASGGDAQGDSLVSIEAVIGSAFADLLTGSAGADRLNGGAGDDTLYGSLGSDQMIGGTGNDTADYSASAAGVTVALDGSAGIGGDAQGDTLAAIENLAGSGLADQLTGDAGNNILTGGSGADILSGGAGDDRLFGGADDDILIGGTGADRLDGGAGFDTADYSTSGAALVTDLQAGTVSGGDGTGDTLVSIERIVGTVYGDTLTAASAGSTLEGNAGDDTLIGGVGVDTLRGGDGNDLILGSAGADIIDGGAGTDTVSYAASGVGVTVDLRLATGQVSGGDADGDVLTGTENVTGSALADSLTGSAGANVLTGGDGDDVLAGLGGADTLIGGAGSDTADYSASASGVTVNLSNNQNFGGDAAGDVLTGIENVTGSALADSLTGDAGANVLKGGAGDDVLAGLGGADLLDGGAGSNTADYSASAAGVAVNLGSASVNTALGTIAAGGASLGGDAAGDTYLNIQNLIGSAFDDALAANTAGGRMAAGAGNDRLIAGVGADALDGGAGTDTADYGLSNAAVTVDLSSGTGQGGYAQGDTLTAIENLAGSDYGDTLTGSFAANAISGGAGDDTIEGHGGADTLDGGTGTDTVSYAHSGAAVTVDLRLATAQVSGGDASGDILANFENVAGSDFDDWLTGTAGANVLTGGGGNDVLAGLGGADILDGGAGSDTASYAASSAGVTVNLSTGSASGGDAQGDTLISIEHVIGSALADTLTGSAAANTLSGGAGDDLLAGLGGADTLDGGAGVDTASYAASTAGVTVNLSTNVNTGGDAQGDILTNIENVTGSALADTLTGNAGDNVLSGGDGDDLLVGLVGADRLDGGAGIDTVSYAASGAAVFVDLAAGTASGGDGEGDTLISIEHVIGSAFGDVLTAASSGSDLSGGAGDDSLNAGAGADVLDGGDGTDLADYSASTAGVSVNLITGVNTGGYADGDTLIAIENIRGSEFDDTLIGDNGANILDGGGGNDLLIGGAGADLIDGGLGIDIASYIGAMSGVTVNLATGMASDGDRLVSIENLTGSNFNDTLIGDAGVNVLSGGAGDDVLAGLGGADVLDGGAGSNTADYSAATGRVYVNLTTGSKTTYTGVTIAAGTGKDNDAEGDTYIAIQNVTGSAYDDFLYAAVGGGRINAGNGDDTIYANAGVDIIDGGAGTDIVSYELSSTGVTINLSVGTALGDLATGDVLTNIERISGSGNVDTLTGNSLVNSLYGNNGNDTIEGLGGADRLDGGGGIDTVTYANSGQGVTVDLRLTTAQISAGDASGDILSGFENLTGSAFNDVLTGDAGVNVIKGGVGNDVLDGGAGADTLDGGGDIDTASYANSTAGVTIDLRLTGAQTSAGDANGDILISIENVAGSALADMLTGNASDNQLFGGAGDDTLTGLWGADVLDGGDGIDTADYSASVDGVTINLALGTGAGGDAQGDTLRNIENVTGSAFDDLLTGDANANTLLGGDGDDVLAGLGGADVLDGGAGSNTADYSASAAGVTVNLSNKTGAFADAGRGVGGDAEGDSFLNIQNVIGSALGDYIYANTMGGTISTGAGDDTIVAGAGRDVIDGGVGIDTVNYSWSTTAVTVNLLTGIATGGFAAGDVLSNIENLTGSDFNDTLTGDAGANTILGGLGNDTIEGGVGDDYLDGGAGTDTLSYANATSGIRIAPNYNNMGVALAYNTVGAGTDKTINFEYIVGSSYSDIINMAYGGWQTQAGAGHDLIMSNSSYGLIDGGAGIDTLSLANGGGWGGATVDLALNTSSSFRSWGGGGAEGDWYSGIENIVGSRFDDNLTGDGGNNSLDGAVGNDTLSGAAGNDVLFGGVGDDLLIGGAGADALIGGLGTDTASWAGSTAGVTANLETGVAFGGDAGAQGAATAYSNASLVAGWGFTEGTGRTAGTMNGANVALTLNGTTGWTNGPDNHGRALDFKGRGAGNDFATIGSMTLGDSITVSTWVNFDTKASGVQEGVWKIGTANNQWLMLTKQSNGNLYLEVRGDLAGATTPGQTVAGIGLSSNYVTIDQWMHIAVSYQAGRLQVYINGALTGSTDSAVILPPSGAFNSNFLGRDHSSANYLDGQIDDFAVFNRALTEAEIQQLATQKNGIESAGLVTDTLSGIENLTGTDFADTLTGDAGSNVLDGGLGNDTLRGGAGDDVLIGGAGADTLDGGNGTDIVSYAGSAQAVTVNLEQQIASGGDAQGDTLTSIEGVIGSARNDTLIAASTGSILTGGAGNDIITGGAGNDTIKGDDDLNKLVTYASAAAAGTNLLVNGNFESYNVNRFVGGTNLTASLANGWQVANNDSIYISDSVYISNGSAENQALRLQGGWNNSNVWQNVTTTAGETYLLQFNVGGLSTGTNALGVYFNGALLDTINTAGFAGQWQTFDYLVTGTGGSDKIEFKYLSTTNQVLIDDVVFTAAGGRDVIDGGAGDDTIDGGFGNDTIRGGDGDDHIIGGLGNDTIDGGAGNDTISGDADTFAAPALENFANGLGGWSGVSGLALGTTTLLDGSTVLGPVKGSGNVNAWGQQIQKAYQLTNPSAATTTLSFDLYLLDSFDTNEGAKVYINGVAVLTIIAPNGIGGVGANMSGLIFTTDGGITYTASQTQANYSAGWGGLDQKLTITLTVPTPADGVLTLGFGSNMNEAANNESIAIDNVNVPGSGIVGAAGAAGDDVITGGAGDDLIDGGAGNDRAIFSGNRGDYTITYNAGTLNYTIIGPDGTDTVKNVERFTFDDGTLTASHLVAGMRFTASGTIAENSAAGATAATLAMTDGSSVTYAITGGANAASFAIDGNRIVLANGASLDYEAGATRTLQVTAVAADGSTHVQTVTVNVTDVNEAPAITSAATFSRAENGVAVATLTATDPDANTTLTWSIVGGADSNKFQINAQTGALSFHAAPNFESPQDAGTDNVYNLTVAVSDGTNTTQQNLSVTVTNLNEAPVLTLTGSGPVAENVVAATVATLSLADPDTGDGVTYALSGTDANLFVIDGNVLRLKDGVSLDYEQAATRTVTVTATDAGGLTSAQTLTVNVTDVNEAPTITSAAAFSVAENGTAVATLTATDPDAGATRSWSISGTDANLFHIDAQTGVLSFVGAPNFESPQDAGGDNVCNLTVAVSDGTNTTQQNLAVTVTNVNEAPSLTLTGTGVVSENLVAATVANFAASDPDAGTTLTYTLGGADANLFVIDGNTVRLKDGVAFDYEQATHRDLTLTASDGANSVTRTLTVNVTDVNEAPTITSAAAFSVAENGTAVATLTATDPDAGATRSWSISGTDANLFHIDAQTGVLSFVGAPNFESPQDAGGDNVYNLAVAFSDGTNTTQQAVVVTVTNVNDAPVITSAAAMQAVEGTTAVATPAACDEDGNTLSWAIAGGVDAAKFSINSATGALRFLNAPSYDSPSDSGQNNVYDLQVRVSDGTVSAIQTISVTVLRDQQAPQILNVPPMMGVSENSTMVMVAAAQDPNSGDTITWSIAGGADAAKFTIDAQTGVLQFVSAPDREQPADANGDNVYNVVLQAQDQTGLSSTRALAVTVTDVDETPVFSTAAALSAPEQQTAVATILAADPERSAVTYSIVGGADAAKFIINDQTGQLAFVSAQDYQNPGDADHDRVYQVVVRASDGSLTADRTFNVTLTDVNQTPSFTSATTASVVENSTAVMTVAASDPDAGTTLTFAISGGADASLFTIDSQTGQLSFRTAPNYEVAADANHDNVYDLTVLVSDGTNAQTEAVIVTVTDVAEAPVIAALNTLTVNEGHTTIISVAAADQDSQTLTYSISGGADSGFFTIDAHSGALRFVSTPDYEAKADFDHNNIYDVQISVSDGSLVTSRSLDIILANVPPTITSSASFNLDENALTVGSVAAHDPAGGALIYALAGGSDANLFAIDPSTGALTFRQVPNFESPSDSGHDNRYNLSVLVSDGTNVATQAIEVIVGDVNETPSLTLSSTAITINENIAGASIASFTGSDPDSGDHLHYALSGADAVLFEISGGTVKLMDGVAFDYETKSAYTLELVATDDHGLGSTQSISILVGDVQGETLVGTSGDDRLVADIGNDILEGGAGADQLVGGSDIDTSVYIHSAAGVTVDLATGIGHGGEAEGDTLSGIENIVGSDFADDVTGDANVNILTGGDGNDTLIGLGGADFLIGGSGDDILYVDRTDTNISGGTGNDTAIFTDPGNIVLTGFSGIETLDFRNGGGDVVTINSSIITNLAPENNVLTINRESGDSVNLDGGVATHSVFSDHGITYDVFSMRDDHNHDVTIHLQVA